ncbi:hypothetical protein Droror1_Dr00021743 [Drosera rotundifolia]
MCTRHDNGVDHEVLDEENFVDEKPRVCRLVDGQFDLLELQEYGYDDDGLRSLFGEEVDEIENRRCSLESGATSDQADTRENIFKAELETAVYRTADLEDKLVRMEMGKSELEMALILCQGQLEESSQQLKDRDIKLQELQNQLSESQEQTKAYQGQLKDAKTQLVELKCQLALVNDHKRATEAELEAMSGRRHEAESQLEAIKGEMVTLRTKLQQSRDVAEKERASYKEALTKSDKLEEQLLRLKYEADLRREADFKRVVNSNGKLKVELYEETTYAVAEKTVRKFHFGPTGINSLVLVNDLKNSSGYDKWDLHRRIRLDMISGICIRLPTSFFSCCRIIIQSLLPNRCALICHGAILHIAGCTSQ